MTHSTSSTQHNNAVLPPFSLLLNHLPTVLQLLNDTHTSAAPLFTDKTLDRALQWCARIELLLSKCSSLSDPHLKQLQSMQVKLTKQFSVDELKKCRRLLLCSLLSKPTLSPRLHHLIYTHYHKHDSQSSDVQALTASDYVDDLLTSRGVLRQVDVLQSLLTTPSPLHASPLSASDSQLLHLSRCRARLMRQRLVQSASESSEQLKQLIDRFEREFHSVENQLQKQVPHSMHSIDTSAISMIALIPTVTCEFESNTSLLSNSTYNSTSSTATASAISRSIDEHVHILLFKHQSSIFELCSPIILTAAAPSSPSLFHSFLSHLCHRLESCLAAQNHQHQINVAQSFQRYQQVDGQFRRCVECFESLIQRSHEIHSEDNTFENIASQTVVHLQEWHRNFTRDAAFKLQENSQSTQFIDRLIRDIQL